MDTAIKSRYDILQSCTLLRCNPDAIDRMTPMKTVAPLTILLALAACTATPEPKEPPLEGILTLSAGPCLGFCPVYAMRLNTEDRYRLNAQENTTNPGKSRGALPVGSFRKALEALDRYDFETMQNDYTPATPENCPEIVTDTPTLAITRRTDDFRKSVSYNTGCLKFADKDRLNQLAATLRKIFRIDALVAVGEPPKKNVETNETNGSNINADEEAPVQ